MTLFLDKRFLLAVALAVLLGTLLSACQSRKLTDIYDPTYVEQLDQELSGNPLILPPGLTKDTSDEFNVPEKINARLEEYRQIFGIFSHGDNFSFQTNDQGEHWLRVRADVARIWLGIKEFFRVEGLEVDHEQYAIGEMRTSWTKNLARNRYYETPFSYADRYLIYVIPEVQKGWYSVRLRHQGVVRDLRQADTDDPKAKEKKAEDDVVQNYLRAQKTTWQKRPSEPSLELEMLTRMVIFLGLPDQQAQDKILNNFTGILGRIYLERSEFGDVSLVVGDNLPRTYFYVRQALREMDQFIAVNDLRQPEEISFTINNRRGLSEQLPERLILLFARSSEFIKLLLFDDQKNIVNPVLSEDVYRLLVGELRPNYRQIDFDDLELIDTKNLLQDLEKRK